MKKVYILIVWFILIIASLLLVFFTREVKENDYYDEQITAVNKVLTAFESIRNEKERLGIKSNVDDDILNTGMIGFPFPLTNEKSITTSRGVLTAKRTSTNPNFVALFMNYYQSVKLRKGDVIALNFSSSFPALNIQAIIAAETLELKPIISTSIGASTYGANDPDFTYLDMEKHLYDEGIISNKSRYVSLGGSNDTLRESDDENFKQLLLDRYMNDYEVIYLEDFVENVKYRYEIIKSSKAKLVVNTGGNIVGTGKNANVFQTGLIKRASVSITNSSGIIELSLRDGLPVVNMLNINDLAKANNMEVDAKTPYTIGSGDVFMQVYYNKVI